MRILMIDLGWPDRKLSPNARGSWRVKEDARKNAFDEGFGGALLFRRNLSNFTEKLCLHLEIYPPDNRRRDIDNVIASTKHHIDGVFHAIQANDSMIFRIIADKMPKRKKGLVRLTISSVSNEEYAAFAAKRNATEFDSIMDDWLASTHTTR